MMTIAATDTIRAPRADHPDDLLDRATIVVSFHGVERRYGDVTALVGSRPDDPERRDGCTPRPERGRQIDRDRA